MVPELVVSALAGVVIGLSLAVPPGPVNALIASHAVARSWRAGFLVGAGATTADTIFLGISLAAQSLVTQIQTFLPYIGLLGAAVMASFAWAAARTWRSVGHVVTVESQAIARSYATGLAVNITSPYPILWWLTAGLVLQGQFGVAVLVGFFGGLLLWITVFPLALREAQRRFAQTYHVILLFSIVSLLAFAGYLVWSSIDALL